MGSCYGKIGIRKNNQQNSGIPFSINPPIPGLAAEVPPLGSSRNWHAGKKSASEGEAGLRPARFWTFDPPPPCLAARIRSFAAARQEGLHSIEQKLVGLPRCLAGLNAAWQTMQIRSDGSAFRCRSRDRWSHCNFAVCLHFGEQNRPYRPLRFFSWITILPHVRSSLRSALPFLPLPKPLYGVSAVYIL